MIYKLFLSLIFSFLYGWFTHYPLYAQPIIVNEQPAKISKEEQSPPPPLGPACSGVGGPGGGLPVDLENPTCCVSGYVYFDGKPVKDAVVTVTSPNQAQNQTPTPIQQPTFNLPIELSSLEVEPRSTITLTLQSYIVTTLSGDSYQVEEPAIAETDDTTDTVTISVPRFSSFINFPVNLDTGNLELGIDEPVTIAASYTINTPDSQEYADSVTITQEVPAPSYHLLLHTSPLDVQPGDQVTITASYKGMTQEDSFIAQSGTIQVDVVLPNIAQNNLDAKPIATISYLHPKDLYQHETIHIQGRATDPDDSNVIRSHRWKLNGEIINRQVSFTLNPYALPLGVQTFQYDVQDNEGNWSDVLTEEVLIRESERVYLPTIMH